MSHKLYCLKIALSCNGIGCASSILTCLIHNLEERICWSLCGAWFVFSSVAQIRCLWILKKLASPKALRSVHTRVWSLVPYFVRHQSNRQSPAMMMSYCVSCSRLKPRPENQRKKQLSACSNLLTGLKTSTPWLTWTVHKTLLVAWHFNCNSWQDPHWASQPLSTTVNMYE